MTPRQQEWLIANPAWQLCGPPRPGVNFSRTGTLYDDGRFEENFPMKPIRLEPGCKLVGIYGNSTE